MPLQSFLKEMEVKEVERALITKYRSKLYRPFIKALQEYDLIQENDVIGVCISGGKDSLLMAKLFQELLRHSDIKFSCKFLSMNPGFNDENLHQLQENCRLLDIPIIIKESNIFEVAYKMSKDNPCYLCARMRRGFLYEFARENGCNKIAVAHHLNDVIETTLLNVMYSGNYKTMVPKLKSTNFKGMELIRPMVYVLEEDIISFTKYVGIKAMSCGCKIARNEASSKRKVIKALIAKFKKEEFKNVEMSIYRSSQNVNLNCCLGWKQKEKKYSFLNTYDDSTEEE